MKIPARIVWFFVGTCLAVFPPLMGQTDEEDAFLENQEENDTSGWVDLFENLRKNPIDLNQTSYDELQTLPLITPVFVKRIVEERKIRGPFFSWQDFARRMYLNISFEQTLHRYFYVSSSPRTTTAKVDVRFRLLRSFPESEGYRSGTYPGNPLHAYGRVKVRWNDRISAGLLVEKDPGEPNWNDHRVGFVDFRNATKTLRLLLGNFFVESGQGLVLWSPYGSYKGTDPMTPVQKRPLNSRGYLFTAEQRAFQGVLVQSSFHSCQWTLFGSGIRLDAAANPDGTVGGISATGLHRTGSERRKHNSVSEGLFGTRLESAAAGGSIGLTAYANRYSKAIAHQDRERYRYAFTGKKNHVVGLDWNLFWRNHHWTGEAAVSRSKGKAVVSTLSTEWDRMDFAVSFRSFDPDFHNSHASGFSTDEPQNESGWYYGLTVKLSRHSKLGLYFDLFRKPWRTYFISVPTWGEDLFLRYDQTVPGLFSFSAKIRFRLSEKMASGKTSAGVPAEALGERLERLIRLEIRTSPFRGLLLKTNFGAVRVHDPESADSVGIHSKLENGFLVFQNLRFQISRRFELACGWALSKTDSYDSRLYSHENDLSGVCSFSSNSGEGTRGYMLVRWHPSGSLGLSAKYSRVIRRGVSSWGSGADKIPGNSEDDAGFQVDWTF